MARTLLGGDLVLSSLEAILGQNGLGRQGVVPNERGHKGYPVFEGLGCWRGDWCRGSSAVHRVDHSGGNRGCKVGRAACRRRWAASWLFMSMRWSTFDRKSSKVDRSVLGEPGRDRPPVLSPTRDGVRELVVERAGRPADISVVWRWMVASSRDPLGRDCWFSSSKRGGCTGGPRGAESVRAYRYS